MGVDAMKTSASAVKSAGAPGKVGVGKSKQSKTAASEGKNAAGNKRQTPGAQLPTVKAKEFEAEAVPLDVEPKVEASSAPKPREELKPKEEMMVMEQKAEPKEVMVVPMETPPPPDSLLAQPQQQAKQFVQLQMQPNFVNLQPDTNTNNTNNTVTTR